MNDIEKKYIYKKAKRIIESNLSWKDKYNMIFSEEISQKFDFDWLDLDLDYKDDVLAFMEGFDKHMQKIIICEDDEGLHPMTYEEDNQITIKDTKNRI